MRCDLGRECRNLGAAGGYFEHGLCGPRARASRAVSLVSVEEIPHDVLSCSRRERRREDGRSTPDPTSPRAVGFGSVLLRVASRPLEQACCNRTRDRGPIPCGRRPRRGEPPCEIDGQLHQVSIGRLATARTIDCGRVAGEPGKIDASNRVHGDFPGALAAESARHCLFVPAERGVDTPLPYRLGGVGGWGGLMHAYRLLAS